MNNILVSGCGISYGQGERPTWVKILKICGLKIKDLTGPGITNGLILNLLIDELYQNDYSYVICQLTQLGKLDVEINEKNKKLMESDSLRNYSFKNYWPSSFSRDHLAKQMYYDYLYSPNIEEKDLIIKLLHLQKLCEDKKIKLLILQGTKIKWQDTLHEKLHIDKNYSIIDDYELGIHYEKHNHTSTVITPNINYQLELTKKINDTFLHQNIEEKINKFYRYLQN
tara:strand:- start:1150 stop:1827 length:678 start_codon:yes stop_codon:yes gene_type:complete